MSMNNKLKIRFSYNASVAHRLPLGIYQRSDFEVTGKDHRVTANLLTKVEQDHKKIANPRVRPGQPYNQGLWPDP